MGLLGIHTLGFYVDSAFADIRFDRALFPIVTTAFLNMLVDLLSGVDSCEIAAENNS